MRVDAFIIQLSAPADRGTQEEAAVREGAVPIVVFANGPANAFLVKARPEDIDAALEAAWERTDDTPVKRLDFRRRVFAAMAAAVESGFEIAGGEADFPNDAVILFAEALADQGVEARAEIEPCAVRFQRDALAWPDYETAED